MEDKEITEVEFRVIDILRKLRPYGKIEIVMNQSGSEFSVMLMNPTRIVLTKTDIKTKINNDEKS